AANLSYERERKIRKEVAQLAAETAEKVVVQAGLSKDTVDRLKAEILGIV
ncbi:phage protein Gp27 family protein, partial [Ursidibacter sp. B-7004-1]